MGLVSLPNTFSASTVISSSEVNANFTTLYNEFNGSIAAANLSTDSVTTAKIADSNVTTAKIADDAVTPAKLATHVVVGTITFPSADTSDVVETGVGFTPQAVEFRLLNDQQASNVNQYGYGAMDASGNQWAQAGSSVESGGDNSSTYNASRCIMATGANASVRLAASFSSMDSDGFTLTTDSNGSGAKTVGYIAYG